MKCKSCATKMFIDRVYTKENEEIFSYKCPNPNCVNYGYKDTPPKNEGDLAGG